MIFNGFWWLWKLRNNERNWLSNPHPWPVEGYSVHYSDVTMGEMTSQITSLTIVYSTVYSGADQGKHQSSASLSFVRGSHRWPVNSPHKGLVTWKMFPFDDVIMTSSPTLAFPSSEIITLSAQRSWWTIFFSSRYSIPLHISLKYGKFKKRYCLLRYC